MKTLVSSLVCFSCSLHFKLIVAMVMVNWWKNIFLSTRFDMWIACKSLNQRPKTPTQSKVLLEIISNKNLKNQPTLWIGNQQATKSLKWSQPKESTISKIGLNPKQMSFNFWKYSLNPKSTFHPFVKHTKPKPDNSSQKNPNPNPNPTNTSINYILTYKIFWSRYSLFELYPLHFANQVLTYKALFLQPC